MNLMREYSISWSRGSILSSLNNGAVRALKGALLMMRMACFCFFQIFSKLVVFGHPYINAIGDIGMEHRVVQFQKGWFINKILHTV
jgi:hypothetical protein